MEEKEALFKAVMIILNKYGPTESYCNKQCPIKDCDRSMKKMECVAKQVKWYEELRSLT